MKCFVAIFLIVSTTKWTQTDCFRIGSFNLQVFGASKAENMEVMLTVAEIIQRYDILLIQEIRDKAQTAIEKLIQMTNDFGPSTYDMVISDRLGRSQSKEQYAFLYKKDTGIEVTDSYQYPDAGDEFERPPFAVLISSQNTNIQEFVLAGVHVDPDTAVQEINSLVAVHADLQRHWETDNILIMGDFNADCSYVGERELKDLELRKDNFVWLIDDELDTTTKATDCAYDRFVMTGDDFLSNVVPDSATVYDFGQDLNLTYNQTVAVSDHYPIELDLESTRQDIREDL